MSKNDACIHTPKQFPFSSLQCWKASQRRKLVGSVVCSTLQVPSCPCASLSTSAKLDHVHKLSQCQEQAVAHQHITYVKFVCETFYAGATFWDCFARVTHSGCLLSELTPVFDIILFTGRFLFFFLSLIHALILLSQGFSRRYTGKHKCLRY